jgi:WD40 repeat protein
MESQPKTQEAVLKAILDGQKCRISRDNKYVVYGSEDNLMIVWNLKTKTQEAGLRGHCVEPYMQELEKITNMQFQEG